MTLVPAQTPASITTQLDSGRRALAIARDDFERLRVRDVAKALEAAANILKHKDIQVEAASLVMDAEREIAKASPSKQGQRPSPRSDGAISGDVRRKIRQAHAYLDDDEYEEIKQKAREEQVPLTRSQISKEGRKKNKRVEKQKIVERRAMKMEAEPSLRCDLHLCSITDLIPQGHVQPESLDFVITDPPYDREAVPLFGDLAVFSAQALKPGGSLLCLSGTMFMRDQLAIMEEMTKDVDLQYWWTLCYDMSSQPQHAVPIYARKCFVMWKPIFWFVRGDYTGEWVKDTVIVPHKTKEVKAYHHWGQNPAAFDTILDQFAFPGQLVCDPFVGGGTTAVSARRRGCGFIGCDIDPEAIETTRERMILFDD